MWPQHCTNMIAKWGAARRPFRKNSFDDHFGKTMFYMSSHFDDNFDKTTSSHFDDHFDKTMSSSGERQWDPYVPSPFGKTVRVQFRIRGGRFKDMTCEYASINPIQLTLSSQIVSPGPALFILCRLWMSQRACLSYSDWYVLILIYMNKIMASQFRKQYG